jgi:hypothetical protein
MKEIMTSLIILIRIDDNQSIPKHADRENLGRDDVILKCRGMEKSTSLSRK